MSRCARETVEHWRRAAAGQPRGDRRWAEAQVELGAALLRRYGADHAREDLIEATVVLEAAIRTMADSFLAEELGTPHGVLALATYTDVLLARARVENEPQLLDIAERYLQFADDASADLATSALLRLKTCQVYRVRHDFDGSVDTLYRLTAIAKLAERWISEENRPALRGIHAEALLRAYQLTGVEDYVDEALELVSSVDATGPNQDQIVVLRARCLLARAAGTTHTADAERAVAVLREHTPQSNAPRFLTGQTLLTLVDRTGRVELLGQAWQEFAAVLNTVPERHPDHRTALASLSTVGMKTHQLTGDISALETAIGLLRRALALSVRGEANHALYLDQLGYSLRLLYDATGEPAYVEEALDLLRRALDALPARDPQRVETGLSIAQALRATYLRTGDPALLTEAAERALAAGRTESGAVPVRIQAFDKAAYSLTALNRWEEATDAFDEAITLLPRLASRGRTRHDQYADLGSTVGMAATAASCAIGAGQPERALELLERGRGLLLHQRLTADGEWAALQRADGRLAADFQRMRRDFEAPVPESPRPTTFGRDRETEWNVLLATIRKLPGLGDFLRPPSARQLLDQVDGTVIVPIASELRCDALILRQHRVTVLPLPDLSLADAMTQLGLLQEATTTAYDPAADARSRLRAQSELGGVLDWLWNALVGPVLDRLDAPGAAGELPRVWWCPVGPLAFFPLHAAQADAGRSALDRVVSSYTPTVTALARKRTAARPSRPDARSCVVAMRATPGGPGALPSAEREAESAARALPQPWLGLDATATRQQVLDRLADSAYAHFACHAVAEPHDPAQGRLLVHDHQDSPLTVTDVSQLDLDAEFAFLSACATAQAPLTLVDESLHITGAFQLAGFRHVIGTLWEVDDAVSLALTTAFYAHADPTGSAAYALHSAVRGLRDRYPLAPTLWAAHIHTGG
ncbi:CHAT domain-containing protein [Micromonospora sp. ALFpr18c]|uniref:CHAT domain-containing protein n=1 Tax=unclassified Micromonospora TaxID=2617518 RepID=UPI00124B4BB8|nr:CHAT domain-containing protein [Micromonospora sp. ALFpr18c]KAB1934903.1 CHAT domain-containing protein [Micromonospora sp. ALFpr18c]